MKILYTTEAVVEGGRAGHGRTSDGRLAVELSVPKELGGEGGPGTNPDQLFAVGYAACFHSGLLSVAQGRKLDASDSTVTAQVGIGPTGRGLTADAGSNWYFLGFEGQIEGQTLQPVDQVHLNKDGKINQLNIYMCPIPAAQKFAEVIIQRLQPTR